MSIWAQVTSIPNGTRIFNHGFDQCVGLANFYHEDVLGGSFVPVQSAYQWWSNSYAQVDAIYTRSAVPVAGGLFVARYGIYNAPDGHIGIVTKVHANGTFDTIEQNAGTWRYVGRYTRGMANMLGFLVPRNNPANVPLEPTQRKVGASPVKRRADASSQSAEKQPPLDPHGVANFNGWRNGERVNDGISNTDVWFRGISGDWFWSGGFTSQSTAGLTNLNPPAAPTVNANQRQADPEPVNVREQANTTAKITGTVQANAIITPEGWVRGQEVAGISVWYKITGGYVWAGGFIKEDTSGLIDLNPATPAPTPDPLPTDPTGPTQDVGPGAALSKISEWSRSAPDFSKVMERPVPRSVVLPFPDHIQVVTVTPTGGFNVGREGAPVHGVIHHAAQPNLGYDPNGNHSGLVRTLLGPGAPTTQAAMKDDMIVRMVDSRDTAATNGRWMSNTYGVNAELANDKTTTDKPSTKTHETAAWFYAQEALQWGWKLPLKVDETMFGHKDVSKSGTACPGLTDVAWITNRANEIIDAARNDTEPPAPDYSGLEGKIDKLTGMVQWVVDLLKRIFKGAA